jgi:phage-related protein
VSWAADEKPLHWVGSSKRDFLSFLHAFQKNSSAGIRTAKRAVDFVAERLKTAERDYEEHYGKPKR